MVDLSQAPFHLDAEAVAWVEDILASMTLDEKLGQLFINLDTSFDEDYLDTVVTGHKVGGIRFMGAPSGVVQQHIRYAQSVARIPLLVDPTGTAVRVADTAVVAVAASYLFNRKDDEKRAFVAFALFLAFGVISIFGAVYPVVLIAGF